MKNIATFGLIKSFGVDGGQLDGMSPQQCFVLGYELAEIDFELTGVHAFRRDIVNAANRERIEAACREAGREFIITESMCEEWISLDVAEAN